MKRNISGMYEVTEGDLFIRDTETNQNMLFLVNEKENLVIRSMVEEDIKPTINLFPFSSTERRKRMQTLWKLIPKPNSQEYFFVVEKIIGTNSSNIYEKDRKLIGIGVRDERGIDIQIPQKRDMNNKLIDMLKIIAEHYGISGMHYIIPAK